MPLRVEVRQSRPNYRVGSANINVNVNDYPINQRQRWSSIYLEELFIRTPFQTGRMRESLTVRRVGSTLRGTYRVPYAARVAAIHRAKGNDFVKKAARATGRRIRRGGRRTGRALGETAAGPRAFAATRGGVSRVELRFGRRAGLRAGQAGRFPSLLSEILRR